MKKCAFGFLISLGVISLAQIFGKWTETLAMVRRRPDILLAGVIQQNDCVHITGCPRSRAVVDQTRHQQATHNRDNSVCSVRTGNGPADDVVGTSPYRHEWRGFFDRTDLPGR